MLELKRLKRVYDGNDIASFIALDNVDINIMHGDFISIIERSGNGKSTMLNMVVGLLRPAKGY